MDKNKCDTVFLHNLIKGRIAETIIERLFLSLGFRVFHYGMENTIPGIIELLKNGEQNEVSIRIRRMPDFVIYKEKQAFFVEVKYVASEEFSLGKIQVHEQYPYPNALFIVISKSHIKCISYDELLQGESITPHSGKFLLGDRREFKTDKKIIKEYLEVVQEFYKNID